MSPRPPRGPFAPSATPPFRRAVRLYSYACPSLRPPPLRGTVCAARLSPGKADFWDLLGAVPRLSAPVFPAELGHAACQLGPFRRLRRVVRLQLAALRLHELA